MRTGKVLVGTLVGVAIGAIAGILLAPEKGTTTRKRIRDAGDDYVKELKSKLDKYSKKVAKQFESAKKDAEDLVDRGKAKYEDAKQDAKDAATNFKREKSEDIKHANS